MRAVPGRPSWKVRLARALGFDGNPLRRASDRAEAWIRAGLLIILLIAGPIAAVAAGQWTAHAGGAETSMQPHAVRAALLLPTAAPARPAEAFRSAQVWDRARESAGGPPHRADSPFAAVLTAVMTLAVTALALLVVLRLIQSFLDWRRLAAWEAALRRWQEHEAF